MGNKSTKNATNCFYRDPDHGAWHKAKRFASGVGWVEIIWGNKNQFHILCKDLHLVSDKVTLLNHFLKVHDIILEQFYDVQNNDGIWREAKILDVNKNNVFVQFSGSNISCWICIKDNNIAPRNTRTNFLFVANCISRFEQHKLEEEQRLNEQKLVLKTKQQEGQKQQMKVQNQGIQEHYEAEEAKTINELTALTMETEEQQTNKFEFHPFVSARHGDIVERRYGKHGSLWKKCRVVYLSEWDSNQPMPHFRVTDFLNQDSDNPNKVFVIETRDDVRWMLPTSFRNHQFKTDLKLIIKPLFCYDIKVDGQTWLHGRVLSQTKQSFQVHISGEQLPRKIFSAPENFAPEFRYTERQRVKWTIDHINGFRQDLVKKLVSKMKSQEEEMDIIEFCTQYDFFKDKAFLYFTLTELKWSFLHLAVYYGYARLCCLICKAAPLLIEVKDMIERFPIDIAAQVKHPSIFQLLFRQQSSNENLQREAFKYKTELKLEDRHSCFKEGDDCDFLVGTNWVRAYISSIRFDGSYCIHYEKEKIKMLNQEFIPILKVFQQNNKHKAYLPSNKCGVCLLKKEDHPIVCTHVLCCIECELPLKQCPLCR